MFPFVVLGFTMKPLQLKGACSFFFLRVDMHPVDFEFMTTPST